MVLDIILYLTAIAAAVLVFMEPSFVGAIFTGIWITYLVIRERQNRKKAEENFKKLEEMNQKLQSDNALLISKLEKIEKNFELLNKDEDK